MSEQCPRCFSRDTYKNGANIRKDGEKIQRYFCNKCQKTFQVGGK